jgi:hypothetical protein
MTSLGCCWQVLRLMAIRTNTAISIYRQSYGLIGYSGFTFTSMRRLWIWRLDPRKRLGENLAEGIVVTCCRCLPTESFYTIGVVSSLN